jgi:hypothetical protein
MLKSAYGEECLSRTSAFEWRTISKKSAESESAKITGENNVDCICYAKSVIHHEFVSKNKL